MNDKFDFQEALSYIKAGIPVKLTLGRTVRKYIMGIDGNIICIPAFKEYLKYTVKHFKIDAVLSNNWELCD